MASFLASEHDPLFGSAWLKWGQAVVHTQALEAEIDAFRKGVHRYSPLFTFRTEYHANRHGFSVIIETVAPIPARWRLLLGDIANNYRAALDHLAWALVTSGRTPPGTIMPGEEKRVYFPIYETRPAYNAALARKLPGVRRADLATVRRYQPYHHSVRNRRRLALVILASVNNDDKHRTVQPLWVQPTSIGTEITNAWDCVPSRRRSQGKGGALEVNTELTFIPARKVGPNPQIEVQPRVAARPSIGNRIAVEEWIAQCGGMIFGLLASFSKQPDEIRDLGATLAELTP